ncbi:hypothetical protein ASG75_10040 [Rhodanobacter sp. Soil772]|nr:hypothetical protein ASG75_10040 [Rhodanobacter sp. Soil772]
MGLPLGDTCAERENSLRLGDKAVTEGAIAAFEAATAELLPKLREQLRQLKASLRLEANSNVSG